MQASSASEGASDEYSGHTRVKQFALTWAIVSGKPEASYISQVTQVELCPDEYNCNNPVKAWNVSKPGDAVAIEREHRLLSAEDLESGLYLWLEAKLLAGPDVVGEPGGIARVQLSLDGAGKGRQRSTEVVLTTKGDTPASRKFLTLEFWYELSLIE